MTIIDKVIAFANKLPMHKELITKRQLTGNEPTIYLNDSNKDYHFSTTAIRILYSIKQTDNPHVRTLYDYNGDYDDIYLNSIGVLPQNIFGVDEHHGLDQIPNEVPVFHYRLTHYGATYYVTDDHLEDLYIALDKWILNTRPIAELTKKKNRKQFLETEIKELQEELNTINKELETENDVDMNNFIDSILNAGDTIDQISKANSGTDKINPLITAALDNSDPHDETI